MGIYYQDELVTIYCGDCLAEHVEWLAGDVLVTDPPYGTQNLANNPRGGYGRRQDAKRRGSKHAPAIAGLGAAIANDATTETRDEALNRWGGMRPVMMFGSPRMPEPPGQWDDRLVWDKKRPGMNGGPFRYTHEAIYARGMVRTNNATFSVFSVYPDQTDHIHAKPLALMEALVSTCPPGVIVDPFAGSGSTLVACRNLGRRCIGVELEEKYCALAVKRLQQGAFELDGV